MKQPAPVDTPEGLSWLREEICAYLRLHPGAQEDRILKYIERQSVETLDGPDAACRAVEMLAHLAETGILDWYEQRGKPDAPLRYRLRSVP